MPVAQAMAEGEHLVGIVMGENKTMLKVHEREVRHDHPQYKPYGRVFVYSREHKLIL